MLRPLLVVFALLGCSQAPETTELTMGAYTTPREAYAAIIPAFRAAGGHASVRESYLGSGAQARAIVGGFDADVAALSLEPDIALIEDAGLIRHDWREHRGGVVTRSVVVIGVRAGNPKHIRGWQDLARDGVEVLTPNVRTSGGAMWNVLALHGAALRGHAGVPAGDHDAAIGFVGAVLRNVQIMDRGARESLLTFERGVGDAIITYENEILVGRAGGQTYEYIVPDSTILIENPVAVVDVNAERHGMREEADAFVRFLFTPEAQRIYAAHGLRPVDPAVEAEFAQSFAATTDLFTVRDLGGWAGVTRDVFGEGGVYDRALASSTVR